MRERQCSPKMQTRGDRQNKRQRVKKKNAEYQKREKINQRERECKYVYR